MIFQSNRVTLKMDVSHTEHSHVIGKGGNNIKKVMMDTGCHIHFPDSNRGINVQEKSNQVSHSNIIYFKIFYKVVICTIKRLGLYLSLEINES